MRGVEKAYERLRDRMQDLYGDFTGASDSDIIYRIENAVDSLGREIERVSVDTEYYEMMREIELMRRFL